MSYSIVVLQKMDEFAHLLLIEFIEICQGVSSQYILIDDCRSEGKGSLKEYECGKVVIQSANILHTLHLLHNRSNYMPPLRASNHLLLCHQQ